MRFKNYETGRCLDTNRTGGVLTATCNNTHDQAFAVYYTPYSRGGDGNYGGGFSYMDPQTNRCLDGNVEGHVYTLPCDWNNMYHSWSRGGSGPAETLRSYQTHRCLDSNREGKVYTLPCNWNNTYQNWIIEPTT